MKSVEMLVVVAIWGCGGGGGSSREVAPPVTPTDGPAELVGRVGPVGTPEDLRKHLKPDVLAKAPPDDKAKVHEFTLDLHGVVAKLVWRTFEDGPNKYLLSVGLEVVSPAPNVTVEPLPAMNPTNSGTEAAVIEAIPLKVKWTHKQDRGVSYGEVSIRILADGTATKL